jgi:hypothetical protein
MGIAMMRPTIPIAALMVVTAVDHASTMSFVQSVNATSEILVSATIIWVKGLVNAKSRIPIIL